MEDFIIREINKIGKIIEAILVKIGVLKKSGDMESLRSTVKTELAEKLDMDIDVLAGEGDLVGILIKEYGFNDEDLGKFAELLFDFTEAAPDKAAARKYIPAIAGIYKYLRENTSYFPFNGYYILKELDKYV